VHLVKDYVKMLQYMYNKIRGLGNKVITQQDYVWQRNICWRNSPDNL